MQFIPIMRAFDKLGYDQERRVRFIHELEEEIEKEKHKERVAKKIQTLLRNAGMENQQEGQEG